MPVGRRVHVASIQLNSTECAVEVSIKAGMVMPVPGISTSAHVHADTHVDSDAHSRILCTHPSMHACKCVHTHTRAYSCTAAGHRIVKNTGAVDCEMVMP